MWDRDPTHSGLGRAGLPLLALHQTRRRHSTDDGDAHEDEDGTEPERGAEDGGDEQGSRDWVAQAGGHASEHEKAEEEEEEVRGFWGAAGKPEGRGRTREPGR